MQNNQAGHPPNQTEAVQLCLDIPQWVAGNPDRGHQSNTIKDDGYPLKRLFDIAVVLAGLAISAPLWFISAIAIKLEDGGPVFFTQERWGKNKSKIIVYKFRTMVPNAVEKFGHIQAEENDPRVTKIRAGFCGPLAWTKPPSC